MFFLFWSFTIELLSWTLLNQILAKQKTGNFRWCSRTLWLSLQVFDSKMTKKPKSGCHGLMEHMGMFAKMVGFPPKSSHFNKGFPLCSPSILGFSIMFTIQRPLAAPLRPVPLHLPNCERCLGFFKVWSDKKSMAYWTQQKRFNRIKEMKDDTLDGRKEGTSWVW